MISTVPELSVVIPTHSRAELLREALDSLGQASEEVRFEVLVVDNSPDGSLAGVANRLANGMNVHLISERRPGLHYGRHTGAHAATAPIVAYLDDDVLVSSRWPSEILAPFSDARVGAVGGRVLPRWLAPRPDWMRDEMLSYLSLLDLGENSRELQWPQDIYGCNMAFRRELIISLRGFNPDGYADPNLRWFRGDGETGFLRKVYAAGWLVLYSPQACVQHAVTPARVLPEYFERRAFMQAISDSFSLARAVGPFRAALKSMAIVAARRLRSDHNAPSKVIAAMHASYLRGRFGHAVRLLMQKSLREHVCRPDYVEGPFE